MTFEKLYDLNTVLTELEIEELRELCYDIGNSAFPIDIFFNDIERNKSENYNKNKAYKDLWLVVLYFLECEKKLDGFSLIKRKKINIKRLLQCDTAFQYNYAINEESRHLDEIQFIFLKEVLL